MIECEPLRPGTRVLIEGRILAEVREVDAASGLAWVWVEAEKRRLRLPVCLLERETANE